jgi:hypothetical protein
MGVDNRLVGPSFSSAPTGSEATKASRDLCYDPLECRDGLSRPPEAVVNDSGGLMTGPCDADAKDDI